MSNLVYAKLFLPFTNIACIFTDDFGGLYKVAKVLAAWLLSTNNRSHDIWQRIFILQRWADLVDTFNEKLVTIAFIDELC